jgi:hypothetical protein
LLGDPVAGANVGSVATWRGAMSIGDAHDSLNKQFSSANVRRYTC